jgi:hypothetical protein
MHDKAIGAGLKAPLSPSDSSPNELRERQHFQFGCYSRRSPSLLGELSEGLRGRRVQIFFAAIFFFN